MVFIRPTMVFGGLNSMLETYSGRDKIIRLLGYTSKLVGGLRKDDRLLKFSDLMSECRTTLRLFDDIPMLYYSLSYGLGKKEPDMYMQVCGVVINALDQIYYPCEHVAWASDKGLMTLRSDPWWMASNVCWTFSLYFNIARSLRYLTLLHDHNKHLDLSDTAMREEYKKNSRQQLLELVTSVRCACDLVHAVHWMPEGFLWSGRLEQWQIGALGTVSSLLSILQSTVLKKSS